MDHAQEQCHELEALQSIYPDEIRVINESFPAAFVITVSSDQEEYLAEDEESRMSQFQLFQFHSSIFFTDSKTSLSWERVGEVFSKTAQQICGLFFILWTC